MWDVRWADIVLEDISADNGPGQQHTRSWPHEMLLVLKLYVVNLKLSWRTCLSFNSLVSEMMLS